MTEEHYHKIERGFLEDIVRFKKAYDLMDQTNVVGLAMVGADLARAKKGLDEFHREYGQLYKEAA